MLIAAFMDNRDFRLDSCGKRVPPPLPGAANISADVDRHLHEPGFHRLVNIETMEGFKDSQKNFLRRVLGVISRSQQLHAESQGAPLAPHDTLVKSSCIA